MRAECLPFHGSCEMQPFTLCGPLLYPDSFTLFMSQRERTTDATYLELRFLMNILTPDPLYNLVCLISWLVHLWR